MLFRVTKEIHHLQRRVKKAKLFPARASRWQVSSTDIKFLRLHENRVSPSGTFLLLVLFLLTFSSRQPSHPTKMFAVLRQSMHRRVVCSRGISVATLHERSKFEEQDKAGEFTCHFERNKHLPILPPWINSMHIKHSVAGGLAFCWGAWVFHWKKMWKIHIFCRKGNQKWHPYIYIDKARLNKWQDCKYTSSFVVANKNTDDTFFTFQQLWPEARALLVWWNRPARSLYRPWHFTKTSHPVHRARALARRGTVMTVTNTRTRTVTTTRRVRTVAVTVVTTQTKWTATT